MLPLEEAGRAALPEPVVETAAVGAPLLAALDEPRALARPWLARIAAGDAIVAVGHARRTRSSPTRTSPTCCCSRATTSCTRCRARDVALERAAASTIRAQRLFRVDVDAVGARRASRERRPRRARCSPRALDRGALAAAAQLARRRASG